MQVRIYQQANDGEMSIEQSTEITFGTSTKSLKRQVGTLLSEVFHRMDFYREVGSRYCTCSAPLLITFRHKGVSLDLGQLDDELVMKLKPSYNAKGRIRYASRVFKCVKFMLETPDRLNETVDVDDLIAGLEALLED